MPDETTILSLPLILPAQAQKHVTHNEALVKLDLMVQLAVLNRNLTAPPALPTIGDRHIVAVGATGAWVGQAGRIALYTEAGWQFTQPLNGWQAYVMAESQMAFYNGLTWIALSDGPFTVGRLGVSATPDATNRLSVSSPATLLNHAGAGHQLKLNKALATDTASLLFQTGFGGRAEMGTSGADDFSVKVSSDGTTWSVALVAAAATGEVTLPKPVRLGGQAADPSAPANGTLWLNTTTGEVKIRSNGTTQVVGGGGVADGDKGDITVSGSGAVWTIDAGAVSLGKMADLATSTILGRATAGTGAPEALTAAQVRTILNVANGATANAADAVLLARANHTGTQAASTITGLAAVATSGSAADLTAGTLPAARFDDTAHGARAGGTLHAAATTAVAGFLSAADKTKLDGVATGANAYVHPNHSGDVTSVADGATTIVAGAVTNAKLANMAANTVKVNNTAVAAAPGDLAIGLNTVLGRVAGNIVAAQVVDAQVAAATLTNAKLANVATATLKGRATAGTGAPEDLTGTQATALLDTFSATLKGLAPASGGGTANFLRADGTWAAPAAGGGVTDGDKGDITVSGSGATWTIDAGVITLAKMANLATSTILGRATAGAGVPEALTAAQVRTILNVADGATANATDAALRDRATHTGTQAATTITGLATVATSGSAADLGAGTLPAARPPAFGSGDVSFAVAGGAGTIAADAVTNAKLANMPATTIKGNNTGAVADPADLTGTQVTALLDAFTSAAKGLAPASGGGTANFLRADGTWAAPPGGGGGSPGGVSGEVQFNSAGAFAGAADVEIEGGQLRLPVITTPAAPASGGLKLYGGGVAGMLTPAFRSPTGNEWLVQPHLGFGQVSLFEPASGTTVTNLGMVPTTVGTATSATYTVGSRRVRLRRIEYLVTTAATTAVAGWRSNSGTFTVGGASAWEGGFYMVMYAGPSTGITNASHRFFMGVLGNAAAPSDVNPSTQLRCVGLGYDAADTQVQIMTNDATGVATKVALGASFPKPNADRAFTYRLELFSPPGATQSVSYRATYLETGAVAEGTITADLPGVSDLLQPYMYSSVGGVSAVTGLAVGKILIGTEY